MGSDLSVPDHCSSFYSENESILENYMYLKDECHTRDNGPV